MHVPSRPFPLRPRLSLLILIAILSLPTFLLIHTPVQSADDRSRPRSSRSSPAITSASSATRSPTACSTTAGWKPTSTAAFPSTTSSFRNLGFSGDELTIRLRSANFGTPGPVADRRPRPTSSSPSSATTSRSPARRGWPSSRRTSTASSSTRSARSTTARARRAWSCSRRSPTRICTTATCPTARRTTNGSSCTPRRWPRSPRPTTCLRRSVPADARAVRQGRPSR